MGEYPAVFPIELLTRIIASLLTGTTLVAAKLLGKNYIGIDISEKYVEYARMREGKGILGQLIRNPPYNTCTLWKIKPFTLPQPFTI